MNDVKKARCGCTITRGEVIEYAETLLNRQRPVRKVTVDHCPACAAYIKARNTTLPKGKKKW